MMPIDYNYTNYRVDLIDAKEKKCVHKEFCLNRENVWEYVKPVLEQHYSRTYFLYLLSNHDKIRLAVNYHGRDYQIIIFTLHEDWREEERNGRDVKSPRSKLAQTTYVETFYKCKNNVEIVKATSQHNLNE
jgi:hypothetical protein